MSQMGHSRPSHFVPVLNNVRYASDSDHSRYESELTLWATSRHPSPHSVSDAGEAAKSHALALGRRDTASCQRIK